jgi:DNA-binding IclR family transcriptional regulator
MEEELAKLYPTSELQRFTDRPIGSRERLIAAVAEAREAGGAEDWEEMTAGCVARRRRSMTPRDV